MPMLPTPQTHKGREVDLFVPGLESQAPHEHICFLGWVKPIAPKMN